MNKKKWDLAALASIPLIMTLANSMIIPILPLLQKQLNIAAWQSSLIITVYAAISIILIPIAGYLSDRYGRKKIIIIGLTIVTVGGAISGLAGWLLKDHVYLIILFGRFIQGIGSAGAFPIVIPFVGDMFNSDEQVSEGLGKVETANTFGKVLSPVLGSALALIAWYVPLVTIPIICIISIVAVCFLVKTPKPATQDQNKQSFKNFVKSVKSLLIEQGRWIYAIFVSGCLVMFILFGFLFYLSSTLEDKYHFEGVIKGLLLAIPLSAICLASYVTGKTIGKKKSRMKWCLVIGSSLLTGSMVMSAFIHSTSITWLIIILVVGGAGIGLMLPSLDSLITEGIEKEKRGTITSLYSSMRLIGVALGPLITSIILTKQAWLFGIFALCGIVCCTVSLIAIKPESSAKSE
ncbi:MAG: MFS transporter [Candidatus Cohnella colombiensis]|uniref:MFS transporter n=1 Tax=Candidatus Cohnella colombiensis TaxID=3121368 RepID=A0AA95JEB1_9BACL|nr:MAG: MFS transporter [Cohnella sp.]